MADFTLEEIVKVTQGAVLGKEMSSFSGIVTDTRRIRQGCLFIALKGEKFDGHDFLAAAIDAGAAGVVVSRDYDGGEMRQMKATVIKVTDTLHAYQAIAAYHRGRFDIPVIAVTGSNGKTTTKDLTAAVLSGKWNVLKTQANYNNEIGLPLTLLQLDGTHEAAVVEMGMRGFGQITQLAQIAKPGIGVVTNVGETHIELLGSLENIAAAKGELVDAISPAGTVVLNGDDVHVKAMAAKAKGRIVTFGLSQQADIRAENIARQDGNTCFTCIVGKTSFAVKLPLPGRHNVYNALAAVAVGFTLGLNAEEIKRGLAGLTMTGMRLEVRRWKEYTVINDAYNASPASMRAAIATLAEIAAGRKVAVVGDMLELGDFSPAAHEAVGRDLAEREIDVVVTLGEMGKAVAESARRQGREAVFACATHEEAAAKLREILREGDTVLLKGSRGMRMEKVMEFI